MKNNTLLVLFCSLLSLAIYNTSCTSDQLPEPMPDDICDTHNATYNGDVKAIVDATCALAGCHVSGGGAPGNFEAYEGLAEFANDAPNGLRDRVIVLRNDPDNGMPPDWSTNPGPIDLTDEQFEIFQCWVDSGYPEN